MSRASIRVSCLLAVALAWAGPSAADQVESRAVFERLKSLAGSWSGPVAGEGDEAEAGAEAAGDAVHEFRVSAAGTVVMEMMGPGTEHEMINMYHLDGDDLLVTHYCAGGNQPQMRLDRTASTPERLVFAFAGGTNLDPAVDPHIHSAEIRLVDADHLDSIWTSHVGGQPAGVMTFRLARSE